MRIKEGEKIPNKKIFIFEKDKPKEIEIKDLLNNKKIILFGLPGAFTSVCSSKHLPGYLNSYEKIMKMGIDKIICISVNDPFVMNAWGKENMVHDKILMISDPFCIFTKSIGAEIDKTSRGLGIRSNRYSMYIENMKLVKIKEEKDTGICDISSAEIFLKEI